MGLLDQLWDDTVAGPQPDCGLGKLRKYSTFNSRPNSRKGTLYSLNVRRSRRSVRSTICYRNKNHGRKIKSKMEGLRVFCFRFLFLVINSLSGWWLVWAASDSGNGRSYSDDSPEEAMRVTRSIMIVKPPGYLNASPPVSPAGSTPPVSPFSGKVAEFFVFYFISKCPLLFAKISDAATIHEKWGWGNPERSWTKWGGQYGNFSWPVSPAKKGKKKRYNNEWVEEEE